MVQGTGDALEWALALAKTPAERVTLRQRPLPDGMQQLLQIAGDGAIDTLAELAAQTGEEPGDIVEAARFYAREVLFFQPADAYRVLGVSHHDHQDVLRSHHRLLQQWLHPDRHTSDWDAIFASRVNAAWNLLRTPERRLAYDQANPPRPQDRLPAQRVAPSVLFADMQAPHAASPGRWRRRAPVLMLAVACAALWVLAVRDMEQDPQGQDLDPVEQSTAGAPVELPRLHAPASAVPPLATLPRATRPPSERAFTVERLPEVTPPPATRITADSVKPERVAAEMPVAMPRTERPMARSTQQAARRAPEPAPTAGGASDPVAMEPARIATLDRLPAPQPQPQPAAPQPASVQRVQQAQQVGGRLIAFMAAPHGASPPIWSSPIAQSGAVQLRDVLHGDGNLQISDVHWRVGETVAALQADLRYADGNTGRLSADLVWREQRWLVTGLSVERDL